MCVPRLEALRWLSKYIQAQVPELKDVVCVVVGDPNHQLQTPSLAITPIQFNYEPNQAIESYATYPDRVVMAVGNYRATLQLRITTATVGQRYYIEEKVSQLFLSRVGGPGVLVGHITTCQEFGPFYADFEYESNDWIDDEALELKYVSLIVITAIIPALTIHKEVYEVAELILGTEIGTGDTVGLPIPGESTATSDNIDAPPVATPPPSFDETGVTDPTPATDLGSVTEDGDWEIILDAD